MDPAEPGPDLVKVALHHAGLSLPVFRLRPRDKRPLAKGWQEEATTDPDAIRELWSDAPDANVGIPTGRRSGLVVPDVDPRNGGRESLEALCERFGLDWLDTLTVRTGGGGWHPWFRYPPGRNVPSTKLAKGIDLQSDGKLVVAPGSIHPSGKRYEVEDPEKPIRELPGWIVDLVQGREHSANGDERSTRIVDLFREGVEEGNRNEAISYLARHFARQELAPDIATGILEDFNRHKVRPPIDESDPGEKSIAATVQSNYRTVRGQEESEELAPEVWTVGDLVRADLPDTEWVAEGFLPKHTVGATGGLFDVGKSWFALEVIIAVALGRPVFDHFPVPDPLRSLIIMGEGTLATDRGRLLTLGRGMGVDVEAIEDMVHIVRVNNLQLGTPKHDNLIRRLVQEHEADLLWIDPFVEFFAGEEKSDADLKEALHPLRYLRDDLGTTVHLMLHARQPSDSDIGKPPGVLWRGHTVTPGWADIGYLLEGPGRQDIQVRRAKSKNCIVEEEFTLRWIEGETDEGETLRLVHEEESEIMSGGQDLSPAVERGMQKIRVALTKHGPNSVSFFTGRSSKEGAVQGGREALERALEQMEAQQEIYVDRENRFDSRMHTVMWRREARDRGYTEDGAQGDLLDE